MWPICSAEQPWGMSQVSPADRERLDGGNRLARAVLRVIRACQKHRVPWLVDNPNSSYLWATSEFRRLLKIRGVDESRLDMCAFGRPWKKRTRILSAHVPEGLRQSCLERGSVCRFEGLPHRILSGSAAGGTPWTKVAEAYPPRLARVLARILAEQTRAGTYDAVGEQLLNRG